MIRQDSVQHNRYEMKYLINETIAQGVRDFIAGRMRPDDHMDPAEPEGYMVHSVYLDNIDFALCRATMDGEKNRFKLRARFYSNDDEHPVFLEIKRRVNDCILKDRSVVHRQAALELLEGRHPRHDDLRESLTRQAFDTLGKFCQLRDRIKARPAAFTSYQREAYVSHGDDSFRLTLDRHVLGGPWRHRFFAERENWIDAEIGHVILELKFTHRFPIWMRELAHRFQLQRTSVPKYVECVRVMHRSPLQRVGGVGAFG